MKRESIKVSRVDSVKEYTNHGKTIYYHNLQMMNGDKINIGKTRKLVSGDLLSYEIIGDKKEDGTYQQTYPKAKNYNPEFNKKGGYDTKGVEAGHSVNCAIYAIQAGLEFESIDPNMKMENKIYKIALIMHDITSQVKKDIS